MLDQEGLEGSELRGKRRRAAVALLFVFYPIAGAGPSRLAGEVGAKELREVVAREKGRVVLLNFWATWCIPCREEFPALIRLQKSYRAKGLQILGVSTDLARQSAAVERFLAAAKPNFPNYRKTKGGDDQEFIEAVDGSWGGELPFTVLYNRQGRKAKVLSGQRSYAQYEREILALLQ